jgi:FkbM family methyltransferase
VNPSDISITPTLVSGQFEVLELDWLVNNYASSLENESLMIDVGANIGIYSSIFVKLSKNFKVMSFEPDPRSHELLEENLKNNCHNHTQYTIKKVAVSSNIGNINLFQDLDAGKSRLDLNSNGSIQVKATSLDEALHNIDLNRFSSIFLKIDVEGFESQVIDSAKNLLQFSRLNILIEYNPLVSKNTNSYLNIWKRLEEKYTTAFVFSHGKRIRWEPSQLKGLPKGDLANILFDYKER